MNEKPTVHSFLWRLTELIWCWKVSDCYVSIRIIKPLQHAHHCKGICCGSILSLVQIFFSFVSNSLSCYYHTLPYPKTKEKKIWTKDKIEPQHIHVAERREISQKYTGTYSAWSTLGWFGCLEVLGFPSAIIRVTHNSWRWIAICVGIICHSLLNEQQHTVQKWTKHQHEKYGFSTAGKGETLEIYCI